VAWSLDNNTPEVKLVDHRIIVNRRNTLASDDLWYERRPGSGIRTDLVGQGTGIPTIAVPSFALPFPPGAATPAVGFNWAGPGASAQARNFWEAANFPSFNIIVELHLVPFNGAGIAPGSLIGRHEFTDGFSLTTGVGGGSIASATVNHATVMSGFLYNLDVRFTGNRVGRSVYRLRAQVGPRRDLPGWQNMTSELKAVSTIAEQGILTLQSISFVAPPVNNAPLMNQMHAFVALDGLKQDATVILLPIQDHDDNWNMNLDVDTFQDLFTVVPSIL
jgi:hypothetical protein